MLRNGKKCNHINSSIETRVEKCVENKQGTKKMVTKNVANLVDTNITTPTKIIDEFSVLV